jgi:hypothetical protein
MLYSSTGALVQGAMASKSDATTPPKTVVQTRGTMKEMMLINSLVLVPTTAEPNMFPSLSKRVEYILPQKQRRVYHGF